MKDFFVCKTIEQFKLACWLVEQGIPADMFSAIDTNIIAVNSPGNVYMEARWVNDHAEIISRFCSFLIKGNSRSFAALTRTRTKATSLPNPCLQYPAYPDKNI